jgi:hypothetical protein
MLSQYQILFYFEGEGLVIMELKRNDMPEDADLAEIFHWLYLEKQSQSLIKLWFRSLDSSADIEERFFEQGYLKFNVREATFIEKYNSAQHKLMKYDVNSVSEDIHNLIKNYLKQP